MNKVKHYKPNNVYHLLIDGKYHYIGCHTRNCEFLSEKSIIRDSGNKVSLNHPSSEELYERVKLLKVEEFNNKEDALNREEKAIKECKELYKDLCVNIALEGNRYSNKNIKLSSETKKKISDSLKGHTRTEESIKKQIETRKLRGSYNHSEETKLKISKANKGKTHSKDHIDKWRESRKGWKMSDEGKKKISEALKGKPQAPGKAEHNSQLGLAKGIRYRKAKELGLYNGTWPQFTKWEKEHGQVS